MLYRLTLVNKYFTEVNFEKLYAYTIDKFDINERLNDKRIVS